MKLIVFFSSFFFFSFCDSENRKEEGLRASRKEGRREKGEGRLGGGESLKKETTIKLKD